MRKKKNAIIFLYISPLSISIYIKQDFFSSFLSSLHTTAKPAPLKNCTLKPFAVTATTTLFISNLTTVYGYHNGRGELNFINSASLNKHQMLDDNHLIPVDYIGTRSGTTSNNYKQQPTENSGSSSYTANRMLILSSEMQLNLLENDNKSQADGKIVAKRDVAIKTEKHHQDNMLNNNNNNNNLNNNNNDSNVVSSVNINQSVNMKMKQQNFNRSKATGTTNNDEIRQQPLPQPQPYKYHMNMENSAASLYDFGSNNNGKSSSSSNHNGGASSYEARQSSSSPSSTSGVGSGSHSSTMELECIAGYDGGLPQHFILEAYDSRTKRLRLNVTSAYTDIPLFRFDLSGKFKFLIFKYKFT